MAILRKTKRLFLSEFAAQELFYWSSLFRDFKNKLEKTYYGAIVFDYDGTLCGAEDRYRGLSQEVADQVIRLLTENP
jgi:hypothetical protein